MAKVKKLRAVWLGQALKEIRSQTKLTTKQVGDHIGKDSSVVSRMESGEIPVSKQALEGILEVCEMTDPRRTRELEIIRDDAVQGGWWDGYRKDIAATLMDRAWMESKAVSIRSLEAMVLPGLLQLPEYAEDLMRTSNPDRSDTDISRWMDMRMQRQHVITKHRPVAFHSILDEQLLRRVSGSAEVMKEQLDYLAEVSQRPNITIRILRSDRCTGVSGSYELFELVDPYPEVAYVATPAGDLCVEGDELARMTQAYDRLQEASLNPEESRELIILERDKL